MSVRRFARIAASFALPMVLLWQAAAAQQAAPPLRPYGEFLGRLLSSADSAPIRGADIRVIFIDSARTIVLRDGRDSIDIFPDSARARIATSDSAGAFAIRRLDAGRYVVQIRRLGFQPIEAILGLDSVRVQSTFIMQRQSQLLAKVVITADPNHDPLKTRLDFDGFTSRAHSEPSGTFVNLEKLQRWRAQSVKELLAYYGISGRGDYRVDRMSVDIDFLDTYPAEQVIGVEIYRHERPIEFNMMGTRQAFGSSGDGQPAGGGQMTMGASGPSLREGGVPLVLIWTFFR